MMDQDTEEDEREIITRYFHLGYENQVILEFLRTYHRIGYGLSTLKRRLRQYGLRRRAGDNGTLSADQTMLREMIREQMRAPGELCGYRSVWHSLRIEHQIHVPRRVVADIMRTL